MNIFYFSNDKNNLLQYVTEKAYVVSNTKYLKFILKFKIHFIFI